MGGLLVEIIALGLLWAIMPTRIMVSLLLLTSRRPLNNALAYLAGLSCLYLAGGLLLLLVVGRTEHAPMERAMMARLC
jgi:hypothetical protein